MSPSSPSGTDHWNARLVPDRVAKRAFFRWLPGYGDCHISSYSVASHGYAQVGWAEGASRHMVLAHRAAWTYLYGQVPLGMTLDHLCKNRRCINPEHLRMLPNYENARRINGQDWPIGTCRNGHSAEHLMPLSRRTKAGERRLGRTCKLCVRASQAAYRDRQRQRDTA